MAIHNHYAVLEEEQPAMKVHVDNMYNLINQYAKENEIPLTYGDYAEDLVEAIATYIVYSKRLLEEN